MRATGWLSARFDLRAVICLGLLFTATSDLMRVGYTDQITFWQLMWPQLVFGVGIVMTMVPLVEMSTANLPDKDIANGAGQFNFVRTLSTAIATAVVIAVWNDNIKSSKDQLVNAMHNPSGIVQIAHDFGIDIEFVRRALDQVTMGQSVMQATNNTFLALGGDLVGRSSPCLGCAEAAQENPGKHPNGTLNLAKLRPLSLNMFYRGGREFCLLPRISARKPSRPMGAATDVRFWRRGPCNPER